VLATGVAFLAQIVVLRNVAAVSTNLTLMAVPVVGVASSAILLGEVVTATLAGGLMLVIFGVALNLLTDRGAPDELAQPSEVV
jgi:drug/metabolite transporter (DMT)-like permease